MASEAESGAAALSPAVGPVKLEPAVSGRQRLRNASAGFGGVWRVFRANPLTLVGFLLVVLLTGAAAVIAAAPVVTHTILGHAVSVLPYNPNQPSAAIHQGPSWAHPFGTDVIGRDVFSRVLTALPLDLSIGIAISGLALLIGAGLGLVAGFWDRPWTVGGVASVAILRVTDVFLAFPALILALAIAAILGYGLTAGLLAILITWWPYYVRLTRGEVLAVKHLPYITAARAAGVSDVRILFRHVLRNLLEPLIVYWTLDIGTVIITFATIAYFGVGPQPPAAEWGLMISDYQNVVTAYPWLIIAPGLAIFVSVLSFSLLGDGLRDVLDPRSRRVLAAGPAAGVLSAAATAPVGAVALAESSGP